MERIAKRTTGLHKKLATCHPDLVAGHVRCQTCGRELHVDSGECLRSGWPKCCGYTMRLESTKNKPKYKPCKEHPDYDGKYMPLGRGCGQCYLIWYICGQQLGKGQ